MLRVKPYASPLSIHASTDHSQKVHKAICPLSVAALCLLFSPLRIQELFIQSASTLRRLRLTSTLNEIAMWIQTIDMPELPPSKGESETNRFYEDDTVQEASAQEYHQLGYDQGRKTNYTYPTPLSTSPLVALLTQLLSEVQLRDSQTTTGLSQTIPWKAAVRSRTGQQRT
jgi:hypothetical protein